MSTTRSILVIDDDEDFRASMRSLLAAHGYDVIEADSGKEGLRKLAEHKPAAILLDVMMESPVEGYCVTHALKCMDEYAAYRSTPLFMVSSIEGSPDELFSMSIYADLIRPDRYLTKPLDIPRFLDLLQKAVVARTDATAA